MSADGGAFELAEVDVALPIGASAGAHRRMLRHRGRPIFGLTQGRRRSCLYPVFSPAGYLLTSESPSDHPHHNSIWAAADHVHALVPAAGGRIEEYTYNFYVDEVFQGRAPGRILDVGSTLADDAGDSVVLMQSLEWRGPAEWGAPDGRLVLTETRRIAVGIEADATLLDIETTLAAPNWDVSIGPSRHCFFNLRVSDSIATALRIGSDRGPVDERPPAPDGARWINLEGPVGGGMIAGVAMRPNAEDHPDLSWFVTDWGVATARPRMDKPLTITRGGALTLRCRYVLHDSACDLAGLMSGPAISSL